MTQIEISELTPKERLDLIAALSDSLEPEQIVLSPAQEAELARRVADFEDDKRNAVAWETIEAELNRRAR